MREIIDIFKNISKIPHCSFKTDKFRDFLIKEGKNTLANVSIDRFGNILFKKGSPKIALQAHYDMVCIGKAPNIEIIEEDGFLKAVDSSLGSDNGIGVAMGLYFLKKYKNIEVLLTSDEEVGLIGAQNLELSLESKNLLNLDSEEEGDIFVGCAGGVDIFAKKKIEFEKIDIKKEYSFFKISIKNLPGGHSGIDIDKGIKNAIKELAYLLKDLGDIKIVSIEGGEALNSIAKNAYAIVASKNLKECFEDNFEIVKLDENFEKSIKDTNELINMLCSFSQGVRSWERRFDIPKTSINLGKVYIENNFLNMEFFARSMENEELERIKKETICFLESFDFFIETKHQFPAWKPDINDFSKKVLEISKKYFKNPKFKAIHAGLECGILKDKFKSINVVSIGPNIYFPHSTKERCEIDSVFRVAKVVDELIKELQ